MVGSIRNENPSYLLQIGTHKSYQGQERLNIVPVAQIAYAFRGSAVRQGLIDAPWTRQLQVRENAVYLRTTEGEICRTECRSLEELSAVLNPNRFAPIHRSLLVNMRKICNIVPGWVTFVDLAVKGRTESLKTSRRLLPSLRERLGLRSRRRRKLPRADRPIHSPRRRSLRGQTRSPRDA